MEKYRTIFTFYRDDFNTRHAKEIFINPENY